MVAATVLVAACSGGNDAPDKKSAPVTTTAGKGGGVSGFVDEQWMRSRQDEYLAFATEELAPGSVTNVIAHAERATRDDKFPFASDAVTAADFAPIFERIDTLRDTTDFDLLYLMNLWYGYRDALDPELRTAIEQRFHSFKYWFTEPTPPGLVDDRWYWSENHRIIYHTNEYLAGAAFPKDVFTQRRPHRRAASGRGEAADPHAGSTRRSASA